ncbi:MAG: hypothetical protein Q9200_004455 [Gallowayella weberi]
MQNATCASRGVPSTSDDAQRFVVCAMDSKIRPMAQILADPITCLICLPTYSMRIGNIARTDRDVTKVEFSTSPTSRQISGLSTWQMGMSFFHSLGVIDAPNYRGATNGDQGLIWGNRPFESILRDTNPDVIDFSNLYDAQNLYKASRKTFQRLNAQVALLNYLSTTNGSNVRVDYEASEPRFCVAIGVFYAMEAMLCVLTVISVLLAFLMRMGGAIPWHAPTLQGLNAVIDASPKLASLLRGMGNVSLRELSGRLAGNLFRLMGQGGHSSGSCGIDTYPAYNPVTPVTNDFSHPSRARSKTWTPFVMTSFGRILLSHGIVNLPADATVVHYGWTLLPASVFLGLTTFYETLDNAVRPLQPFHNLKHGRTNRNSNTYTKDFGGMIPVEAFLHGLRHRYLAMVAATLATLCAPLFPVVINGLFSPGPATIDYKGVKTKMIGWFNATDPLTPDHGSWLPLNNSDPFMTTRIMYSDASYPRWTYSEFALAEIDLADEVARYAVAPDSTSRISQPRQITVEVPAIQAVMNCTSHPYKTARPKPRPKMFAGNSDLGPVYTLMEVNVTLPDVCRRTADTNSGPSSITCSGDTLSIDWLYKPGIIGYWAAGLTSLSRLRTTIGVFGDINPNGNPKNLTVLTCVPYVESISVNATFNLPSFDLANPLGEKDGSKVSPIVSIEPTRKFFNHDTFWTLFGDSYLGGSFDDVLPSVNLTDYPSPLVSSDGFFQALFQGKDAIAQPQTLLGPANSDKLIAAVEHLYRVIMAQALHTAHGRRIPVVSVSDSSLPSPPPLGLGSIRNPSGSRLYQSHVATYILVALLATMLVSAVVALATFSPKGLVSMEPTSLAARMSLLVQYHAAEGSIMMVNEDSPATMEMK